MNTLQGQELKAINCVDTEHNKFTVELERDIVTFRQPRRMDKRTVKYAWNKLTPDDLKRYRRNNVKDKTYEPREICSQPYYRGEQEQFTSMIITVDDTIVGFMDYMMMPSGELPNHGLSEGETGFSVCVCILPEYRGMGLGTVYGVFTEYLARYFKADYLIGNTPIYHGMYNIRVKQGWETLGTHKGYVFIRKPL